MNGAGEQGYQKSEMGLTWQHGTKARQAEARLPFPAGSGEGVGKSAASAFAEVLAGCGAFEWVALGYLALSSVLIVIFSQNLAHPLRLLSVQALVGCMIVALCRAEANVWSGAPKCGIAEFSELAQARSLRGSGIFGGIGIRTFSFYFVLRNWARWCIWSRRDGRTRS